MSKIQEIAHEEFDRVHKGTKRTTFAVGGMPFDAPEVRVCASCRRVIDPLPNGVYKISQTTVHCGDCLSHHFEVLY